MVQVVGTVLQGFSFSGTPNTPVLASAGATVGAVVVGAVLPGAVIAYGVPPDFTGINPAIFIGAGIL